MDVGHVIAEIVNILDKKAVSRDMCEATQKACDARYCTKDQLHEIIEKKFARISGLLIANMGGLIVTLIGLTLNLIVQLSIKG